MSKQIIPAFTSGQTTVENGLATVPFDKYSTLLQMATGISSGERGLSNEDVLATKMSDVSRRLQKHGLQFSEGVKEVLLTIECIEVMQMQHNS